MRILLCLVAALALLPISTTLAYVMRPQKWATSTVTLQVNRRIPNAMPRRYAVLREVESKINGNASGLRFNLVLDDDNVSTHHNRESELNFTNNNVLLCGSIACAWVISESNRIVEADVFLDASYPWTLDNLKNHSAAYVRGQKRPLLNTAMHECLHSMGVQHENDVINIMGNAWNVVSTNGDRTHAVVSADTTRGLVKVYGPRDNALHDVSVMHWRFDAAATGSNAASSHMRSKLTTVAGAELPRAPGFTEPTYAARPGARIKVQMTLENRGTRAVTVGLGVYWSTNSLISTTDPLLFASNATLGLRPFEHAVTVAIPANAVRGQVYYVGAIIDRLGILDEANERNNGAYIAAIKVQ